MGMNMSEKILAKHAGLSSVSAGQLITCKLDMVLANDITAPPSIEKFNEIGRPVFDPTCRIIFSRQKTSRVQVLPRSSVILHASIRL